VMSPTNTGRSWLLLHHPFMLRADSRHPGAPTVDLPTPFRGV
jgi:hypothetical protein